MSRVSAERERKHGPVFSWLRHSILNWILYLLVMNVSQTTSEFWDQFVAAARWVYFIWAICTTILFILSLFVWTFDLVERQRNASGG